MSGANVDSSSALTRGHRTRSRPTRTVRAGAEFVPRDRHVVAERRCAGEGCTTVLSVYNTSRYCSLCRS